MLKLILMRHAKSDWGDPALSDFDRPLNKRGKKAAPLIGAYMAQNNIAPDLILCSSAKRTRETLDRVQSQWDERPPARQLPQLYDQMAGSYIPIIQANGGDTKTLMLIGHNSATHSTALDLVGSGPDDLMDDMELNYPSGAMCLLEFDINDWNELEPGTGTLKLFLKPRSLSEPPA